MRIARNVHLLESTKGSYVYLVLGNEPVLIDTGMPGKSSKILKELSDLGVRSNDIAHILLTHHDIDHIGNAKSLQETTGARLWAPSEDVPFIHGETSRSGIRRAIQAVMKHERPMVERHYRAGQKIDELEVIRTPGHTPGHVSIRYGDVLFAGDLVMTTKGKLKAAPGFLTWDKQALQKSLREVGHLAFDTVCPAHGLPVKRGNLWDTFLNN